MGTPCLVMQWHHCGTSCTLQRSFSIWRPPWGMGTLVPLPWVKSMLGCQETVSALLVAQDCMDMSWGFESGKEIRIWWNLLLPNPSPSQPTLLPTPITIPFRPPSASSHPQCISTRAGGHPACAGAWSWMLTACGSSWAMRPACCLLRQLGSP